jgi:hypothetical protein
MFCLVLSRRFRRAPRLAGRRAQHVESQIQNFREYGRGDPFFKQYLLGAVAALGRDAARDLASYFAMTPPQAPNDDDSDLAARGRTIYMEGIPEANIVSCYACHDSDVEAWTTFLVSANQPIST